MSGEATKHAYEAKARSADTFGRMFWTARHQHMVSDGPVSLGCPGEPIMPGELFLAGIATCAVQLIEVFAQEEGMPLEAADAAVWGDVDASNQPRPDVTLFTSVRLRFELAGVTRNQGEHLVERFKGK